MIRRMVAVSVVTVLGLAAAAMAAESLESVRKQVNEKTSGYKTVQYDMHMEMDGAFGGMQSKTVTDAKVQSARRDGKTVTRNESTMLATHEIPGQKARTEKTTILAIMDPPYVSTLTTSGGETMAMKTRLDPRMAQGPLNGDDMFKAMTAEHDVKILPDQTVDGREAWVLEMTPKRSTPGNPIARMVNYIDKKTAMPIKTVGHDKAGKQVMVIAFSNVKIDEKIPAERFEFKVPAGVEVMDMTQMGGAGMPQGFDLEDIEDEE